MPVVRLVAGHGIAVLVDGRRDTVLGKQIDTLITVTVLALHVVPLVETGIGKVAAGIASRRSRVKWVVVGTQAHPLIVAAVAVNGEARNSSNRSAVKTYGTGIGDMHVAVVTLLTLELSDINPA